MLNKVILQKCGEFARLSYFSAVPSAVLPRSDWKRQRVEQTFLVSLWKSFARPQRLFSPPSVLCYAHAHFFLLLASPMFPQVEKREMLDRTRTRVRTQLVVSSNTSSYIEHRAGKRARCFFLLFLPLGDSIINQETHVHIWVEEEEPPEPIHAQSFIVPLHTPALQLAGAAADTHDGEGEEMTIRAFFTFFTLKTTTRERSVRH